MANKNIDDTEPYLWATSAGGSVWCGDSLRKMKRMHKETIDLCFTSPPFPLHSKKSYGNELGKTYEDWLISHIREIKRLLKPTGSFVMDLGCCWEKGLPIRNLYDMKLAIRICEELNMPMAQEFYWWNPSRLPTPAQWVTIEKSRLKDSVNKIMWFSKSEKPYANNQNVLIPYSDRMEKFLEQGPTSHTKRPSGHQPSKAFLNRNKGAIPGNLLVLPNTSSSDPYYKYCRDKGYKPHPARFPFELPEFFIKFLTQEGEKVLDPFAGSCSTGFAASKNNRRWVCIEKEPKFLETYQGHFEKRNQVKKKPKKTIRHTVGIYAS